MRSACVASALLVGLPVLLAILAMRILMSAPAGGGY